MARLARIVIPHHPHHLTQRGHRRQQVFFTPADYLLFRHLLVENCAEHSVHVWAYCLMPNHDHLVAVPERDDSLALAMQRTHSAYAIIQNQRNGWKGHFWQCRYYSCPLEAAHLLAVARYVELNPVRAGLVPRASDWPWSSARAHLRGQDDVLVRVEPLLRIHPDWSRLLQENASEVELENLRRHVRTGRPLGSREYVRHLETVTGRILIPGNPGRKRSA